MKKVITIIILIIAASLGFLLIKPKKNEVIPTNVPVTKNPDQVNTVEQGNREMVQVRFSWEVDGIKYNDALYIAKDQYEKMSAEDIDKLKKQRFDNWVKTVNGASNDNSNEVTEN